MNYTKQQAETIALFIDNKLAEFTQALNHWGAESNKTTNSKLRQDECNKNVSHFKGVYDELYSMYTNLRLEYKIK